MQCKIPPTQRHTCSSVYTITAYEWCILLMTLSRLFVQIIVVYVWRKY